VTTLQAVELGVLGSLQVRRHGAPVAIPGAKPRAILTMLGLHDGSVVSADALVELLWGEDPPRTAAKALQTHISSLRRTLGDGFVLTQGAGWTLAESEVDASRYKSAAQRGRDAATAGDTSQAVARFEEALALWRGIPELPDGRRGTSEKTRWIEGHAALVEDRADALLATGRAAEVVGDLEAAVADAPLRERRWGQLMLALYRAGRQGEALGAYQRARSLLADELGVDPGPELRRLEAAIVAQDASLDIPVAQNLAAVTRAVTFFLTDIEGSTAAWEADAAAMGVALARHDELVEQVVTSRGGRLIKTRGEGDATFSVFERPSAAAAAAIELQDAIVHEPWALREPMRVRVALHTGEAELRDGDYFGRAVNRAARLRSLAEGGQILCSGATAELVIDSLSDDVVLNDLGMRQLRNLARPEHVFELRLETADEHRQAVPPDEPIARPSLPAVLAGAGPFVGRERELGQLFSAWQTMLAGGTNAALIAGEPGVGKTRLAGEWSRQAYDQGALVIYGRCDEDLGAAYQPFAEALRSLVPCLGSSSLRGLRGVEALLALVPGLTDVLPDLAAPTRADPDTERYALFDAVVALLGVASASAPVVLILDDLHWAAKPTLLLLRHLLRFGDQARVQIIGTYRSTDLDRSHPLAAMLADLHRDGTANRIQLSGLDEKDVTAYVAEAGYDDEELARALASVTGGNPFFLIEALRHVDESGGHWDPSTLPQGVREAVSRRLSRLPAETNKALAAAAVVGSRFALELVERVVDQDLVDAFDEASKAGIIIEEHGGHYRFNHALVRQSLLAELASVRRMRLHQRIAATLENVPGADDELLAELAYHYFECAWAGNAAKAVDYCRRAADQAMARLGYEGAADLYDRALHALEEIDDELPDRNDQAAELLVARCEALLAAGDVASAAGAVAQLQQATVDSVRLAAWATCFDGELSILIHPERLDDVEAALGAAAHKLAEIDDAAGEAKAHTVRARCLARLGRVGDCEIALDDALTAARRARDHRRVNAVLAGAPLAALWGPNPVPRAGGRCLDVVRLLRITTDSPAVEATSTRCQAVLEAFRGREAAARRMIDSARRTVTELGLRHALLEVEQFAGIVELVLDDPAAAEPHLRQAYNGFRRMGLDADTAETAALLGRACLALDRDAEADELCTESEHLAGHALKASIAWRTVRAQLLSRRNDHEEARRVAQAAITLAERTDGLVDHGDACLSLATVLGAAGDAAGARAAAELAASLYERKGAAALAEKARGILGHRVQPIAPTPPETPVVEIHTAAVQASERVMAAIDREAWDEFERLFAPEGSVESRRKIVGFKQTEFPSDEVIRQTRRDLETGIMRANHVVIAVRGERLALARMTLGTVDVSPGAPNDEFLQLYGVDEEGRIALQVWFDLDDMDAAIAELDAVHARFEEERSQTRRLENTATRVFDKVWSHFAAREWDALAETVADGYSGSDHRRVVNAGNQHGRDVVVKDLQVAADVGFTISMVGVMAIRGEHLALTRVRASGRDPEAIQNDALNVIEIDADERILAAVTFDLEDFDAAIAELDARYLAGEPAAHAHTLSVIAAAFAAINRHELPGRTPDWVNIDHRHGAAFAPGDMTAYIHDLWDDAPDIKVYIEVVHRLNNLGAVVAGAAHGTSQQGFEAEWREIQIFACAGDLLSRCELFDEADVEAALARFEQLSRPTRKLENAATQVYGHLNAYFAARDWAAITELLADDVSTDDRRRVVNSGLRRGRDAVIAEISAFAAIGVTTFTADIIATRGERLVVGHSRTSNRDQRPEAFHNEVLRIVEIDADDRIAAVLAFDIDDFEAAIAELDARYLAGEAAAHSHTWSVITRAFDALNRRELPPTTPDWVNIDHRRGTSIAPGEMPALLNAAWHVTSDLSNFIEAVHRLDNLGAVITHVANETSLEGFHAEWRVISLLALDGNLVNRCEVFDEGDIDAALAKFNELSRQTPRLENAASQVGERILAHFATRDWDAMAEILADGFSNDDRRRVVGAGVRHGRDAEIANTRTTADLWTTNVTPTVIATRGRNLVLTRLGFSGRDDGPEPFLTEVLSILEINDDERWVALVSFDLDDIDAAIAELDARYAAGEAAAHSETWLVIAEVYAALNRGEMPATAPDLVDIDHRSLAAIGSGDLMAYLQAASEDAPRSGIYIETVHRLTDLGAVTTHVAKATSREGFDAKWRITSFFIVGGDLVNRYEIFDEADLEAALARFEQLGRPAPQLENAATQVYERLNLCFAERDWAAITEILAADVSTDDRRRVVNAGRRTGRDAVIAEISGFAEIGVTAVESDIIAVRGRHLALSRIRSFVRNQPVDAFQAEAIHVIEIDADERIVAIVVFDVEDIEAAFEELDARYLAGEAAVHSHTWSVISQAYAALNRRALPATTQDWTSVDHRRFGTIESNALTPNIRAFWDITSEARIDVATVHGLTNLGAVVAHATHATSREGVEIESGEIIILMVEGDLLNRCEIFDEAELDAALARFEQLNRPPPQLENTASRASTVYLERFVARDWDTMADMLADDYYTDDRRHLVGGGTHGRDVEIANVRAQANIGVTHAVPTVIAVRGERLALSRVRYSGNDHNVETFLVEILVLDEINAGGRFVAAVAFDSGDIDAAIAELDSRYLAGEAADHPQTWSVITAGYAALNRHEVPPSAPDYVNIDHRLQATIESLDLGENLRTAWDLTPDLKGYIEAVHQLSGLGAVVTYIAHGTSREGLDAEWRGVHVLTLDGDMVNRCEVFDEADIDAALARFDELHPQTRPLENAATRADDRFFAYFAARNWAALAEILTDESFIDDRRPVVNAGLWDGRDAVIANLQAVVEAAADVTSVIATRGERLALSRICSSNRDPKQGEFGVEMLNIVEIDSDERIVAHVEYDADDIAAAFEELDARYVAGEAAAHAQTWSVIAGAHAGFNRHKLPATTPDPVYIDHRPLVSIEGADLAATLRAVWDITPAFSVYIEAVHRLDEFGAVATQVLNGTSQEGLDAEWRMIDVFTVEGGLISRVEVFEEADLDAALARFDELHPQARRLENAASQVEQRFLTYFAARDWDAYAEILSDDVCMDDRRHVVNAGVRHGRDAEIASQRAVADVGVTHFTSTVIATRGGRLALGCYSVFDGWSGSKVLCVTEINAENQIVARVAFDSDEVDAAFEELDARYLAGEAAAHADTWSVMMQACAAINTREIFATTADFVDIDHRSLAAIGSGDLKAYIRAALNDGVYNAYIEAVHRLGDLGAVVTLVSSGTSQEGFDGEWRMADVFTVEGDLISRCEIFNEADLDAALARFEELQPQTRRLENAAARADNRFFARTRDRNWAAAAEILADNSFVDDRRHVVNIGVWDGRDVVINNLRALADAVANVTLNVIAIRGERLALSRINAPNGGLQQGDFGVEMLGIVELDDDNQIAAHVLFDPDDIDAAFEELDARYLAGEAGAYSQTWTTMTQVQTMYNRHEIPPTTKDWVNTDHRRGRAFAPDEVIPFLRATYDVAPNLKGHIEAVHRLSNFGAVVTEVMTGTSQEGFDAEWREIGLFAFNGDLVCRFELFDETELDAALATFDELDRPAPRLENVAAERPTAVRGPRLDRHSGDIRRQLFQ
jgi:DNA-binding SARP family transcriptional activator